MSEYRAIYKCRLCGEEFESGATTSTDVVIKNMLNATIGYEIKQWIGVPISEKSMHNCKDGSFGLAYFMGFRKTEGKNEPD